MSILQVRRCRHVEAGAPILRAARAAMDSGEPGEAEWRVGCGACAEEDGERATLEQVVREDPSLVEVVLRPGGTVLSRRAPGERWRTDEGPVPLPHRASRHWPSFDPRYPPRPNEPLDEADLTLLAAVGRRGWHTVLIPQDEGEPGYGFTVGLFRRFDHPEVALFGVAPEELRRALDRVGERIAGGERFDSGNVVEGLLDRRTVTLRRIAPRHCREYLGYAAWYHGGVRFPALQCVWSDPEGRFPWDAWFPREARGLQPALYEDAPA